MGTTEKIRCRRGRQIGVEILQDETGTQIAIAIGPIVVYTMWIPQNELRIWKRP